ncbi:MAG: FecR family protein [Verrucomicrobiota bacterium]
MDISKFRLIFCSAILVLFFASSTLTATELGINQAGFLEITSSAGEIVDTLPSGSISTLIQSDNQSFKVSYGKDLNGQKTLIIYPDPENPQSLELTVFGKSATLTEDAVLTIVGEDQFQAGVLGTVIVDGQDLSGGKNQSIGSSPANIAPAITGRDPLLASDDEESSVSAPVVSQMQIEEDDDFTDNVSSSEQEYIDKYDGGLYVHKVEGDAYLTGTSQPIQAGDSIPEGSQLTTGPSSTVVASPFPGAVVQIQQNTNIAFSSSKYEKASSSSDKNEFKAYLTNGGILNAIKGLDPSEVDFEIRTPQGVAAARGTVFAVYTDGIRTLVVTGEGTVLVVTQDGTFTLDLNSGNKVVLTDDQGNEIEEFPANSAELQIIEDFFNSVQPFIDNPGTFTGPPTVLPDAVDKFFELLDPILGPEDITPTLPN